MRKIVVVGNTHAEAETWARENLAHPYVVASGRAHRHLNVVAYGGGEDATPEPMEGDWDEWPPQIDHIVIRG